ncbi:MAG TPA: FtsX-like permease family protein [Steroidobacteraceae bacterium]|nr:FtsX-like permease family protein [Steroidobacteraceae bacterium]
MPGPLPILWAASLRHFLRQPAQLALALVALATGVATIVAVNIATASSRRALELSLWAVNGPATQIITGGPQGLDESLYVRLFTHAPLSGNPQPVYAPVVEGYVTVRGRVMQLIGVDPFASAALAGSQGNMLAGAVDDTRATALRSWFLEPGAVVMAANTARELRLRAGEPLTVDIGGVQWPAALVGLMESDHPGDATLLLADIAQAQEWLGMTGRLTRIDVRTPRGPAGRSALAQLRHELPPGAQLEPAAGQVRETLDMTNAFSTNLTAMSLLALLVSALLIYGAVSFTVIQRRRNIAVLRAIGATRREVLTILLTEAAALGAAGAGLGVLLGVAVGHGLVRLVSQTVNDLYYVVAVQQVALPAWTVIEALGTGFGTALLASLLPAMEVAGSAPQLGLRRSVLEGRAAIVARRLSWISLALALLAWLLIAGSRRSVFAGFAALFLLLCSVAAVTPSVLRALARLGSKVLSGISSVGRLALEDVANSLSRTGVAVAALGMAVAAMIGVSIMVESFRVSLRLWLTQTMRADIYVAAPGPGVGRPERRIEPVVLAALFATPGVADHSASRSVVVRSSRGEIALDALHLAPGSYAGVDLTAGDPRAVWSDYDHGGLLLSDSLAWRLNLRPGERLSLATATGPREFPIAGIYHEYGGGLGSAMISIEVYRRLWHDDAITAVGLYLGHGVDPAEEIPRLEAAAGGHQALLIRSNADIRAASLEIFDRTFIITRVLYWLAAGIAAIGLVSALLAWELDRTHELSVLRALGLTPRGAAALVAAQTAFMGGAALLAAIPAGLIIAVVLTKVIDRRAFGWHIQMHLHSAQFLNALALALAAALLAGLYPAWRAAVGPIAAEMREE